MPLSSSFPPMSCAMQTLTLIALGFGLIATGALSLAVATDYWLYSSEPVALVPEGARPSMVPMTLNGEPVMIPVTIHSGLWRACVYYADLAEWDEAPLPQEEVPEGWVSEMQPPDPPGAPPSSEDEFTPTQCTSIGYTQGWDRVEGGDTTNQILRGIRKASPVIVASLFLLIIALSLSTVGNAKKDIRTLIGACFYIFSALCLAIGVIFYISAVNDEVAHRKKPDNPDDPTFKYRYGWAFFFAGAAFMCSMAAAVANITLYVRRYPNLEDMVLIVPGLEKKSCYDFGTAEENEFMDVGAQNPTIIL